MGKKFEDWPPNRPAFPTIMKQRMYFFSSILLGSAILMMSFGSSGFKNSLAPQKRALIIAVGNYPRLGGWDKLSSLHDAEVLSEALKFQGFNDITVIRDEQATKTRIINTFHEKILKPALPGDIVVIHFSGHGQQIWDRKDDRFPDLVLDETDGFDEALIPFDARDEFRPGVYTGENHLTDDEIQGLLLSLRQKLGPKGQVLFTVDACHSGTVSRSSGLLKIRGTDKKFGPDTGKKPMNIPAENPRTGFMETYQVIDESQLASLIVISASRADQPNSEALDEQGKPIGSLSLSLSRKLVEARGRQNYELFFQGLKKEMAMVAPYQSPQLEGDASLELFVDEKWLQPGFAISSFRRDKQVWIEGGRLSGMYPGAGIQLMSINDPSEKQGVKGKVIEANVSKALVKLERSIAEDEINQWRATLDARFSLASPVRLKMEISDPQFSQKFALTIWQLDQLQIVEQDAELLVFQSQTNEDIALLDPQQQALIKVAPNQNNAVDQLLQRIQKFTQAKYLRTLEVQHPGGQSLQIHPVPVRINERGNTISVEEILDQKDKAKQAFSVIELGTDFIFKVTNQTDQKLFFSILATDPQDEVALLVPDAYTPPESFVIYPDTSIYLKDPAFIFQTAEPRGNEVFTLIASASPLNLRPVFRQPEFFMDPEPGRGPSDWSSEELIANLLFGNKRSQSLAVTDLQVVSTIVEIP